MSPLVRKEIRLILPFFGIAMLLAILPSFAPRNSYMSGIEDYFFLAFGFGVMLLGLAPFGQEFSLGTFSSLLAQPCERRRIWRLKILLVALAGLLVLLAFALSIHARMDANLEKILQGIPAGRQGDFAQASARKTHAVEFWSACRMAFVLLLVAVTGGFWTTLLFRQTGAALWFAILIPGALYAIEGIFQSVSGLALSMNVVLSLYSALGFVWARRMFASAQDSQWLGETVALLSLSPRKRSAEDTALPRRKGALRALVRKEFQSHQISLIIAFGLLVLHVCTLIFRRFETLPTNSELRFAIGAVPLLWLFVPWLIGSVAVAEERKLGTMESQLCLPVNRRLQFAVKLTVSLLLGILLGGVMPCLLEALGSLAGVSSQIVTSTSALGGTTYFATMLEVTLAAGFIVTVSFYTSTLSRNTLHALGGAVVSGGAFFILFQWLIFETNHNEYSLWKGPLIFIIGVPVAFVTVVWLSFSNYKRLHAGRNVWFRNLLILSATLACAGIVSAFVYQRPWEELTTSLEPRHGAPRLSGPIQPAICMPAGRLFALLPDGRLWTGADYRSKELNEYREVWNSQVGSNQLQRVRIQLPISGLFIDGSNWVAVAANYNSIDIVALQSDGTLWQILAREDRTNHADWFSLQPRPRRIGSDSDWKCLAAGYRYFAAVKTNGTLWVWGDNEQHQLVLDSRDRIREPVQFGTDSDWAGALPRSSEPVLIKTDGTVFNLLRGPQERLVLSRSILNSKDWVAVAGRIQRDLVLRRDGTLWAFGYPPRALFGTRYLNPAKREALTRVGNRSDWAQISGEYDFAAIRKDGSLVKNDTEWLSSTFGQPSRYSDWLTLDSSWTGLLALASDGTVSLWRDTRYSGKILLAPSHKPLWNLNIFSNSKN